MFIEVKKTVCYWLLKFERGILFAFTECFYSSRKANKKGQPVLGGRTFLRLSLGPGFTRLYIVNKYVEIAFPPPSQPQSLQPYLFLLYTQYEPHRLFLVQLQNQYL